MTLQEASLFHPVVAFRDGCGAMLIWTDTANGDWTKRLARDKAGGPASL